VKHRAKFTLPVRLEHLNSAKWMKPMLRIFLLITSYQGQSTESWGKNRGNPWEDSHGSGRNLSLHCKHLNTISSSSLLEGEQRFSLRCKADFYRTHDNFQRIAT